MAAGGGRRHRAGPALLRPADGRPGDRRGGAPRADCRDPGRRRAPHRRGRRRGGHPRPGHDLLEPGRAVRRARVRPRPGRRGRFGPDHARPLARGGRPLAGGLRRAWARPRVPGRAEFHRRAAGHDHRSLPRLRLRRVADGHHRHQGRGRRPGGRPGRADPPAHRPAGGGGPRRKQRRPGGAGGRVRGRGDRWLRLRPPPPRRHGYRRGHERGHRPHRRTVRRSPQTIPSPHPPS